MQNGDKIEHVSCLLLLLSLGLLAAAVAPSFADDDSSTETNEVIPREAIRKLDYSVRQALLRAIDKLEQEQGSRQQEEDGFAESSDVVDAVPPTITPSTLLQPPAGSAPGESRELLLEESTSAPVGVVPTVQFFTATFDEKTAPEQLLSSFIDRSKQWKKSSAAASMQATRASARANEISSDGKSELVQFEIRSKALPPTTSTPPAQSTASQPRPRPTRPRTTTTSTTTTTTTPRPTHNEDGENIEVVDKKDIRILEAPLVTAFTVDLDDRGSAKKVIPIVQTAAVPAPSNRHSAPFDPLAGPTIAKLNVRPVDSLASSAGGAVLPTPLPTQSTQLSTTASTFANQGVFGSLLTKQATPTAPASDVSNYFIERQRQLEQQIYQLKLQAQQQQDLILRQLKLLEEQAKLSNVPRPAPSTEHSNTFPAQANQQQQQQQLLGFTIRPSVEFIAASVGNKPRQQAAFPTYPNEQQLPLRDVGVRFQNGFGQPLPQVQHQQLPLQQPANPTFHNFQNFQQQQQPLGASATQLVQIQPSSQLSFGASFSAPPTQQFPELSLFQALPQRDYEDFRQQPSAFIPPFVGAAGFQQQQRQQINQRSRPFRQEDETSNFGLNQAQVQPSNAFPAILPRPLNVNNNNNNNDNNDDIHQQAIENQNFYRQHLEPQLSNQLQQNAELFYHEQQQHQQQQQQQQQQPQNSNSALNHGINAFTPPNSHFSGVF